MKALGQGRFSGASGVYSAAPGGLDATLKKLVCRREVFLKPAVGGTNVLAQKAADFDVTAGFTHPAHARNLQVVFSATWNGGNVVVTGHCADGVERSETFVAIAGGNTAVGTVAFTNITRARNTGTRLAGTVDAQLADTAATVFGVCARRVSEFLKLVSNGAQEAIAAKSELLGTFRPTTVPDAALHYEITYLCEAVGDLHASEEEASL